MDSIPDSKLPEITRQEQFEDAIFKLRRLFNASPEKQGVILSAINGVVGNLTDEQKNPPTIPVPPSAVKEIVIGQRTLEDSLSEMYGPANYEQMAARPFGSRAGVAGVGCTNESFFPENLKPPTPRDGYLIGTGNGAIWSMLGLFPEGTDPKGIISLDMDPSVILSGKVIVELAKRGITREEAIAYLYGDYIKPAGGKPGEYYNHKVEEVIAIARKIALGEQNPQFRQTLLDAIDKGEFIKDIKFMRERHEMDYNKPLYEVGSGTLEVKGRINTAAVIYKYWDRIVRLAKAGKIFFAYSNIKNEPTLDFILQQVPDIATSNNIIYSSNVVDFRYSRDVKELKRFNQNGQSVYVFTTQDPDKYTLKMADKPPVRTSDY